MQMPCRMLRKGLWNAIVVHHLPASRCVCIQCKVLDLEEHLWDIK
jgi:hypothetical protein